jgi:hypothetical protein
MERVLGAFGSAQYGEPQFNSRSDRGAIAWDRCCRLPMQLPLSLMTEPGVCSTGNGADQEHERPAINRSCACKAPCLSMGQHAL